MKITSRTLDELLEKQLEEWAIAKENYKNLEKTRLKEFQYNYFAVNVQFNPARIKSSGAGTDEKSLQERKCFLCTENLPKEQKGISFGGSYQILVNPYPIFPEHFTIRDINHREQLIAGRYPDMLDMAEIFTRHTIFYNGPKSGASAPDHAHFQAVKRKMLPVETDISEINKELLIRNDNLNVYALKEYLRNTFLIEAKDKNTAIGFFDYFYGLLEIKEGDKEPGMNIIALYENSTWYTVIFLREKHRPDCFYAVGEDNILISPGAVDMGGILVTPLEKDFNKITSQNVSDILKEVCISNHKMESIINHLKDQAWNQK